MSQDTSNLNSSIDATVSGTRVDDIRKASGGGENLTPEQKAAALVKYWLGQISQARVREKRFREDGKRFVHLYEGGKRKEAQYNILYSNTEVLSPALYSRVPKPWAKKRFSAQSEHPSISSMGAMVLQRSMEYWLDTNLEGASPFDDCVTSAVTEALVPGRGCTRIRYDAKLEGDQLKGEWLCFEEVPWNQVFFGYAKTWNRVPWVAFEHIFTMEEMLENFPEEKVAKIKVSNDGDPPEAVSEDDDGAEQKADSWGSREDESKGLKMVVVYEIWDKDYKKVRFISPSLKDDILKESDDPYGLSGFFPMPKPLMPFRKIKTLVPTALYVQYEEQAKELNLITLRIQKIIKAMKIRGFYDNRVGALEQLLSSEDNTLIPTTMTEAMMGVENANLNNAIWLMPVEKLIQVAQQLYIQRQQIKTVIYEITGIADILRGSSVASETLGAQQIKEKWGGIRLKRMQKEVANYCRDVLRISSELAINKFSQETFIAMTGLKYPTNAQKQEAMLMVQQAEQAAAQQAQMQAGMAQQGTVPGQPPIQPPAPPPPDPKVEQAKAMLQVPSWEDVLGMLKQEALRSYQIDIETNSTVELDVTEDREEIAQLMGGLGQVLNGLGPLIEKGILPFQAAKGFMLAVSRRFRFGDEVEEYLQAMQEPPKEDKAEAPSGPTPEELELKKQELAQKDKESTEKNALEKYKVDAENAVKERIAAADREAEIRIASMQQAEESKRHEREQQVKARIAGRQAENDSAKVLAGVEQAVRDYNLDKNAQSQELLLRSLDALVTHAGNQQQQKPEPAAPKPTAVKVQRGADGKISGLTPSNGGSSE